MEQIQKIVDALVQVIKQTADFASAQLPDIAQQAVAQEVATCWVWIIGAGFIFLLALALLIFCVWKDKSAGEIAPVFLFPMLFSMPFLFYNVRDLVRVKTAPKIYVLEYFAETVKKLK